VSCEQVKALISIGCCYNLLSEECHEDTNTCPGFPMSKAAKLSNLVLRKSTRDLGCQSAERWRSLTKDIALQNFDIHAFRAAFQMVNALLFQLLSYNMLDFSLSPSLLVSVHFMVMFIVASAGLLYTILLCEFACL
jgi:hypothetical protein